MMTNLLHGAHVANKLFSTIARLRLLLIMFLTLTVTTNAWGETVTFTPSNCTNWTSSQAEQTQTIDGITLHSTGAANNTQLRLYSGATHTFTSTVGNITSILFTCTANGTSNYGPGKMTGDGYVAGTGKTGEWTGNSAKVTLTGGQSRCTSIVVTYTPSSGGGGSTTVDPEVTFSNGEYTIGGAALDLSTLWESNSTGAVTYSVTNAGSTGATINGTYFTATAAGQCTVQASQAKTASHNAITKTATITVNATAGGGGDGECTWQLVTNVSDLAVGDEIVIAASTENYALGTTQNKNNRSATAITQNTNNTITIDDNVQIITLCDGLQDNTLGFSVGDAGFLYAASSTANHLKTKTISDNNCDWVISITDGVATIQAQGTNTRNIIRYNPNNGSPIFACYASSSTTGILPAIYKKVCGSAEPTLSVDPINLAFGEVTVGQSQQKTFILTGQNIKKATTLSISSESRGFSVSPFGIDDTGNFEKEITVTYAPKTAGNHSQTIVISSEDADDVTVSLSGTGVAQTANYTVKHYQQNLDGTYPSTPTNTETKSGEVGIQVTPAVKSYTGFKAPSTQTVTIKSDGSTAVTYQYTRNSYTLTWDVNEGNALTGSYTSGSVKYGAEITKPADPTREGHVFKGWHNGTSIVTPLATMPASNLTYTAQWTPTYTINWLANGHTHYTQTAVEGTALEMPSKPTDGSYSCDDKVFVGWTENQISGSTNTKPADLFTNKSGTLTVNKTYYAVFATAEGVASTDYTKITDINNLTDGNYVIAYGYNTTTPSIILKATTKDETTLVATSASPSSNKYQNPAAENIWTIKKNGTTYTLYNETTSKYVQANTTPALLLADANPTNFNIEYSTDHWKIKINGNTSYQLVGYTNASGNYFQTKSGASGSYKIQLYKNTSTVSYSDYSTVCEAIPDPVWGGAVINRNSIKVDCGSMTKLNAADPNGPATISFPAATNHTLTYDITVAASEGFLVSTNKTDATKYGASVTVSPNKTGDNAGKITQNVYVVAVAPAMSDEDFTGTITLSGKQLAENQVIDVTADVTCTTYTLILDDRGTKTTAEYYAGASVPEPEDPTGVCTDPIHYVFDGWATSTVAGGSTTYTKVSFPYTMPAKNTTLHAVYRYAEEGGEPVNGYVKVTEALADWSGDYVIVDDENLFAIKNAYRENTSSNKTLAGETVTIENDKVVSPSANIVWSFSKNGNGYTMYNVAADIYVGIGTHSRAAVLSEIIADENNIKIIFDDATDIAKVSGIKNNRCFQYYVTNDEIKEWRTYDSDDSRYNTGSLYRLSNKTIRYTSSLVCGSIEAENAIVTSTVGQTIKVYVPITLGYSDAASITGTSDNEAFTVVTKNDVAVGESTIEVHYKPTAYVNTANQEETATITLTTSNAATTTFNVTGRCLPETFAIVAKVGNNWFALPSQGLNSETTPVGYPVKVDNNDNPTVVTSLPTTAEWSLRNVHKVNGSTDRFARNGENLVFINAENKTLYANNGNANIQTYAEYTNYAENNPERYEWVPTTTDLTNYTLKNVGRDKDLSINVNATFGTHASNIASNNLRFLPINATYNPFDMQVVEWYPTKVLVQTEAALTSVSATVGGVAVANPGVTKKGGKLYEISDLPLESNPTKILTISYDTYSCSKVIPIIISQDTKTVTDAPFSTLTKAIYNYSDLVVRDGAVLNITGAKNTPDKFVNVTIYPTAKVVVPENNQLSVYSITFFGGIDDIYDGEKYTTNKYGVPQLSLKGTLGKTVTTMDYIMRVNTDQMYSLGVPYDVALADIKYWDGSAIVLGNQLYVSAYDGQARANREKQTWIYETDFENKLGSATLKAGIGYTISAEPQAGDAYSILRMPMKSNISSGSTEGDKTVSVTGYANTKGATITDNHKGWNLLSNPYMTTISGDMGEDQLVIGYLIGTNWVADTYRYVTIPGDNGKWYYQQKFTDARLLPFKSFFVQVKEDVKDGNLSFDLANRQNAPARFLQQDIVPREVEFELLLSNETQSDNMGLLISEEYTPAYEINADLEKMTGTMSVYTIYNGYTLAYNALSPLNAEEQIPVGYIVPANGEYTFDLKEDGDYDKVEHIYLIDREMDAMVDLLEETYDFYAVEKKNNNRFAISVILKSEQSDGDITTNMGEIDIHNKQPQKFFYDGELYILHDGKVYSATGHEIKTINE